MAWANVMRTFARHGTRNSWSVSFSTSVTENNRESWFEGLQTSHKIKDPRSGTYRNRASWSPPVGTPLPIQSLVIEVYQGLFAYIKRTSQAQMRPGFGLWLSLHAARLAWSSLETDFEEQNRGFGMVAGGAPSFIILCCCCTFPFIVMSFGFAVGCGRAAQSLVVNIPGHIHVLRLRIQNAFRSTSPLNSVFVASSYTPRSILFLTSPTQIGTSSTLYLAYVPDSNLLESSQTKSLTRRKRRVITYM